MARRHAGFLGELVEGCRGVALPQDTAAQGVENPRPALFGFRGVGAAGEGRFLSDLAQCLVPRATMLQFVHGQFKPILGRLSKRSRGLAGNSWERQPVLNKPVRDEAGDNRRQEVGSTDVVTDERPFAEPVRRILRSFRHTAPVVHAATAGTHSRCGASAADRRCRGAPWANRYSDVGVRATRRVYCRLAKSAVSQRLG